MNSSTGDNGVVKKNSIKKFIIIGVVALLGLLIIIFGIKLLFGKSSGDKYLENIFDPKKPIAIKKGNLYGFIDSNGKVMIEPKYESVSDFYGDYARVYGEAMVDGEATKMYQLIDKKGNVKFSSKYSDEMEYYEKSGLWVINKVLYNSSLKQISKEGVEIDDDSEGYFVWINKNNNTAGVINSKGKVVYTYHFNPGESYISLDASDVHDDLKNTYCKINVENKKYALINCDTGKVVYDFSEKYISVYDDNIFKIYDESHDVFQSIIYVQGDKVVYESNSKDVDLDYYYGYIEIEDYSKNYDEKYSYIDTKNPNKVLSKNDVTINTSIDRWELFTGYTSYKCNNGYGLMKNDKVILSCEWDDIDFLGLDLYKYLSSKGKNYILVEKDKKTYLLNVKNGKKVVEFNSNYVDDDYDTTFLYYKDKDTSEQVIYNLLSGKTLRIHKDDSVYTYSNYVKVKSDKKTEYYNTDLKLIYTEE